MSRGYVREYRPGKWSFTCYIGKDENGKNKKMEKGGFTSKKDCEAALNKKLVELVDTGTIFTPSEKTFEEVWLEIVDIRQYQWTPSTLRMKRQTYEKHIKESLGYRFIRSIKSADINALIKEKLSKGYKVSFINNIKQIIKETFTYAVKQKYIIDNPSTDTIAPKLVKEKMEVFTPEEITKMLELTKENSLYPFINIGIYTGMRAGEIFGLRWRDINLDNKTIDINEQLIIEKGRKCLGEPKHGSSRLIRIPQALVDFLLDLKLKQEQNKKVAAELYHKSNKVFSYFTNKTVSIDDFICISPLGVIMHPSGIGNVRRKLLKNGIAFHPHKLRHTYATMLLESGCSIKLLQETLGHKSSAFTLDVYSHVTPKHEQDIVERLPVF